ncbi:ExbD/TolR family protein [Stieleria varia]|uniref:Biopolymer transport protein ExbD/TolR n=1 Tax=Stieleria varia TaxID=2528005 RepID=A0A5C6B6U4_9BACT|nr:biopolymer transporter ExbD [Stieleria varia]TWU07600.1 Biopolymer transport protein ExbD/TolR [Stieleria varia]
MTKKAMFGGVAEEDDAPICDLTNLIDLMVVMGALFLVLAATNAAVSSTRYAELPIELTETQAEPTSAVEQQIVEPLQVTIDAEGVLRVDDTIVSLTEIRARLAPDRADVLDQTSNGVDKESSAAKRSIVIASDKNAPVKHSIALMAEASKQDADISFVTLAEQQP